MIRFQLVTLSGMQFDGDVSRVTVPTSSGIVSLYKDHMPIISHVIPGIIEIADTPSSIATFATLGGIIEIDGKVVRLLADDVASLDNISSAEAEAAVANAEKLVSDAKTKVSLAEAKRQLQYSNLKLTIARKKRH